MPNKIYVGDDSLEIIIDMQEDISEATTFDLLVLKDGVQVTWVATIYNDNFLRYITETDDLDVIGIYYVQGNFVFPGGWSGLSETSNFRVWPKWK